MPKKESRSASLERSRFALERWQGICRRWVLPQRADGSGSRPDDGRLRNHFRQPKRQHAANGCQFAIPRFFGGDELSFRTTKFRDTLAGLRNPTRISDVIASGLDQYDAVFVPGGHGPMMDLLDDPDAGTVLRHFHKTSKPTAVLCHGPISLLSALPNSREWSLRWRRAIPLEQTLRLKAGSMPDIR